MIIGEYRLAKCLNLIKVVPNKVRIGWHFSSNKYAYRDAYSALKSKPDSSSHDKWSVNEVCIINIIKLITKITILH